MFIQKALAIKLWFILIWLQEISAIKLLMLITITWIRSFVQQLLVIFTSTCVPLRYVSFSLILLKAFS